MTIALMATELQHGLGQYRPAWYITNKLSTW